MEEQALHQAVEPEVHLLVGSVSALVEIVSVPERRRSWERGEVVVLAWLLAEERDSPTVKALPWLSLGQMQDTAVMFVDLVERSVVFGHRPWWR